MRAGRPKGLPKTGGGSRKGKPNKATIEVKALARVYGPAAVQKLAEMAGLTRKKPAEAEAVRATCLREILDRGYGKPTQGIELAPTEGFEAMLDRIRSRNPS